MEIKTKFDIGDVCWIEFSGKSMDLPVNGIYVDIFEDDKKIEYTHHSQAGPSIWT